MCLFDVFVVGRGANGCVLVYVCGLFCVSICCYVADVVAMCCFLLL